MTLCILSLSHAATATGFDHDYSLYGAFLKENVVDRATKSVVHYEKINRNAAAYTAVKNSFADVNAAQYARFTEPQKLAYLINTYNFFTIDMVLQHYPVGSIRSIGTILSNPWKIEFVPFMGKTVSLEHIEHDVLRKNFREPRIHFAIVCAAVGCPKLQDKPFTAKDLDGFLDRAAAVYLNDKSINFYRDGVLNLSKIFSWFKRDFDSVGGYQKFVAERMKLPAKAKQALLDDEAKIKFTIYDWRLNSFKAVHGTWYTYTQKWSVRFIGLALLTLLLLTINYLLRNRASFCGTLHETLKQTAQRLDFFSRLDLKNKVTSFVIAICIANFGFLYFEVSTDLEQNITEDVKNRLKKSVATGAASLDFKTHEALYDSYLNQEADIVQSKEFKYLQDKMRRIKTVNNVQNDVYTVFIPYWAKEHMIFLAMSAEQPYLGNGTDATHLVRKVYETKTTQVSDVYETEEGLWVSGAAPILDSKGEVHAVLQIDIDAVSELTNIIDMTSRNILLPVAFIGLLGLIATVVGVRLFATRLVRRIIDSTMIVQQNVLSLNQQVDNSRGVGRNLLAISRELTSSAEESQSISKDISGVVRSMSKELHESSAAIDLCETDCEKGFETLEQLQREVEAFDEVISQNNAEIRELATKIRSSLDVVAEIHGKTQAINDITFQTKLLSFNASVEAARAGEHGKGFSVVALEMASLAKSSEESAHQIEGIVADGIRSIDEICNNFDERVSILQDRNTSMMESLRHKRELCNDKFTDLNQRVKTIRLINDNLQKSFDQNDMAQAIDAMSRKLDQIKDVSRKNNRQAESSNHISRGLQERSVSLEKTSTNLIKIIGRQRKTQEKSARKKAS